MVMSDSHDPTAPPPSSPPPGGAPPPRQPIPFYPVPPRGNPLLGCAFAISLALNILAVAVFVLGCFGLFLGAGLRSDSTTAPLPEHFHTGNSSAKDTVAIISLDGIILEGLLGFVHKEIEQAAKDDNVKAVVLRINSPGGSVTASDDLHRRLLELRDGNPDKKTKGKPIVVSMASMAASGGYYVAMPGKILFAERTTMTGSVGVFALFPNFTGTMKELLKADVNLIKQGEIKDSGSPFKEMTPKERQVWQDMVDHSYDEFIKVVENGRPALKGKMLEAIDIQPVNAGPQGKQKPAQPYQRYRADGGIFTADQALKFGLIDQIGYLEDAVKAAHDTAGLGDDYKAISYERPKGLLHLLLGAEAAQPNGTVLEPGRLKAGLTPRLWYLAPGSELSGMLSAMEGK
jgi:protease-4